MIQRVNMLLKKDDYYHHQYQPINYLEQHRRLTNVNRRCNVAETQESAGTTQKNFCDMAVQTDQTFRHFN